MPPFPLPGEGPVGDVFFHRHLAPPEAGMGMRRDMLFFRRMGPNAAPGMPPPMPPHMPAPMASHMASPIQPDVHFLVHGQYMDDLQALLGPESVGSTIPLSLLRGGQLHEVQVTVAPRPAP